MRGDLRAYREIKREGGPGIERAPDLDRRAVQFQDAFCNRKAQSGMTCLSLPDPVRLIEAVKNSLKVLLGDTGSRIAYPDLDMLILMVHYNAD